MMVPEFSGWASRLADGCTASAGVGAGAGGWIGADGWDMASAIRC